MSSEKYLTDQELSDMLMNSDSNEGNLDVSGVDDNYGWKNDSILSSSDVSESDCENDSDDSKDLHSAKRKRTEVSQGSENVDDRNNRGNQSDDSIMIQPTGRKEIADQRIVREEDQEEKLQNRSLNQEEDFIEYRSKLSISEEIATPEGLLQEIHESPNEKSVRQEDASQDNNGSNCQALWKQKKHIVQGERYAVGFKNVLEK
ncbi:hypothetical protein JTB14_024903 [Gonioctena quinquepunctata]|nr:hypothetical protein JTB14_024903 [Gonioctena quinquepunctata]